MSKLDELLAELCPDGVEYRELKDVLTIKNGKDYKASLREIIPCMVLVELWHMCLTMYMINLQC